MLPAPAPEGAGGCAEPGALARHTAPSAELQGRTGSRVEGRGALPPHPGTVEGLLTQRLWQRLPTTLQERHGPERARPWAHPLLPAVPEHPPALPCARALDPIARQSPFAACGLKGECVQPLGPGAPSRASPRAPLGLSRPAPEMSFAAAPTRLAWPGPAAEGRASLRAAAKGSAVRSGVSRTPGRVPPRRRAVVPCKPPQNEGRAGPMTGARERPPRLPHVKVTFMTSRRNGLRRGDGEGDREKSKRC